MEKNSSQKGPFFLSSGGWGKIKLELTTLQRMLKKNKKDRFQLAESDCVRNGLIFFPPFFFFSRIHQFEGCMYMHC